MTTRKMSPFAVTHYAIPTVSFTEDAGRSILDLETSNFAHSILGHTQTFSALPEITFREKKIIFGPPYCVLMVRHQFSTSTPWGSNLIGC